MLILSISVFAIGFCFYLYDRNWRKYLRRIKCNETRTLKVSKSRNQFMLLLILPKNKPNSLRILSWVCFVRSLEESRTSYFAFEIYRRRKFNPLCFVPVAGIACNFSRPIVTSQLLSVRLNSSCIIFSLLKHCTYSSYFSRNFRQNSCLKAHGFSITDPSTETNR